MAATTDRPAPHREKLLTAGSRSFYDTGYHGATVDSILKTAAVPKGSFYHHFGSKEAFGFAVVQRYMDWQGALLRSWAERQDLTVPERLAGYHQEVISRFTGTGYQRGCLMGKLSHEVGGSIDTFREYLGQGFTTWSDALADLLAEGQERGEVTTDLPVAELATVVLVMLQGGFVSALSLREDANLEAVTAGIIDVVSPAAA